MPANQDVKLKDYLSSLSSVKDLSAVNMLSQKANGDIVNMDGLSIKKSISNECVKVDFSSHFYFDGSKLVASNEWDSAIVPIADFKSRYISVENYDSSGKTLRIVFTSTENIGAGSTILDLAGIKEITKTSEDIVIPNGTKNVIIYAYNGFDFSSFKIYKSFNRVMISESIVDKMVKPSSVNLAKRIDVNGKIVSLASCGATIVTSIYDVSEEEIVYLNYYGKFYSLEGSISVCYLVDGNNKILKEVLSVKGNSEGIGESSIRNLSVDVSAYDAASKKLIVMFTNSSEYTNNFNFVSRAYIDPNEKCLKKLEGTHQNGKFHYNGSYRDNWRLSADTYNVTGLSHVLIDSCIDVSSGSVENIIFGMSDGSYKQVFEKETSKRYGERKVLLPIPSGANTLIVNSSLTRKDDGTPIPYYRTRVFAFDFGLNADKYSIAEIENTKRNSLDFLFIGNSLTQDAVSYLPKLLVENFKDIDFNIYMWYCGGYTLEDQWNKIKPGVDGKCDIFSSAHSELRWMNKDLSMSDILPYITFKYVSVQEYFNYKTSYTADDTIYFNNIVEYLEANTSQKFQVVTLLHAPKRGADFESIYTTTKNGIVTILRNTAASDVIVAGSAIYEATKTALDSLGDQGHLSPDGTHAQEGLPCMLEAYVVLSFVLDLLGKARIVEGIGSEVTSSNYSEINVPGANLGSGVVVGNDEQKRLCKRVAQYAGNVRNALKSGNV